MAFTVDFIPLFFPQNPPPQPAAKNTPAGLAVKTEGARRVTQEMHEQEYQQALVTVKDKIRETEGPDIKETMMDQIRQWFIECRSVKGNLRPVMTLCEGDPFHKGSMSS